MNWVAGQYVAAMYFDMSWNELPEFIKAMNSKDSVVAKSIKSKMELKEKKAIDYYLKNIKPANKYNADYWNRHILKYH